MAVASPGSVWALPGPSRPPSHASAGFHGHREGGVGMGRALGWSWNWGEGAMIIHDSTHWMGNQKDSGLGAADM